MSLSTYFSDNQTKQKAYDRYYNQTARSDFVQRRKLRALIAQEASDESLTDKLAQLYMSSVGKAPDYAYDKVLGKLQKASPEVIKGPTSESMESFKEVMNHDKPNFESFRKEELKAKSYGDAKRIASIEAKKYVEKYQKMARSDKTNANRVLSPDQEEVATKKVVKNIMNGFRRDRDSVGSTKPRSRARKLVYDQEEEATGNSDEATGNSDEEEEKMSEAQLRRVQELTKQNPGVRAEYQRMAKTHFLEKENYDREAFFDKFKHDFRANIDIRHRNGYFDRHFRRPDLSLPNDQKRFKKYKMQITTTLNKALPI